MTEDTDFGRELIASMQEAAAIVRGEKDAVRVHRPAGDTGVLIDADTESPPAPSCGALRASIR